MKRRHLLWAILGLSVVSVLWLLYHSHLNFDLTKDWFENRNKGRLTGMILKVGESTVFVRNTNLLSKIDLEIPRKTFSPGPETTVAHARLELDGKWRGWVLISCDQVTGVLLMGIPEKFSLFPVEFDYATLRIAPTNLYYLSQVVDAAYRLAE